MPVKTKRWNDPVARGGRDDDGFRLLVCRYRPRALPKADETWDAWQANLGPSRELHAVIYGKRGAPPLPWPEVVPRYLAEMRDRKAEIAEVAARVAAGETVTLLCSSACVDPDHCHRTLLARLVEEAAARDGSEVLRYAPDGRHRLPRPAKGVSRARPAARRGGKHRT